MRNTASDDYAIAASFDSDGRNTTTAANGQLVHKATLDQMERLAERLYEVSDGVWVPMA
jgi:hypothetical protein